MREVHKLVICCLVYRVVCATGEEVPKLLEHDGWADTDSNTIFLKEGMPPTRMRDTLVHEIAHAWLEASGLGEMLQSSFKGADFESFEEQLIRVAVPSILQLVQDNGTSLVRVPAAKPKGGKGKRSRSRR